MAFRIKWSCWYFCLFFSSTPFTSHRKPKQESPERQSVKAPPPRIKKKPPKKTWAHCAPPGPKETIPDTSKKNHGHIVPQPMLDRILLYKYSEAKDLLHNMHLQKAGIQQDTSVKTMEFNWKSEINSCIAPGIATLKKELNHSDLFSSLSLSLPLCSWAVPARGRRRSRSWRSSWNRSRWRRRARPPTCPGRRVPDQTARNRVRLFRASRVRAVLCSAPRVRVRRVRRGGIFSVKGCHVSQRGIAKTLKCFGLGSRTAGHL